MRHTLLKSKFGRAVRGAIFRRDATCADRAGRPVPEVGKHWEIRELEARCVWPHRRAPTCSIADLEHARI